MKLEKKNSGWKNINNNMTSEQDISYQRGEILIKLNRLVDMRRLKLTYTSMCQKIDEIEINMKDWSAPRNPRQNAIQCHDKKTLQVLKNQTIHQEEKIRLLEEKILQDIEESKKEII